MLAHYLHLIECLPAQGALSRSDLLTPDFFLEKNGTTEIYYAPHNDIVNERARIVIVGITPGWTQMERAYRQVRDDLQAGLRDLQELERRAKAAARFVGTMRTNLIEMLDACGVAEQLGLASTAELFAEADALLHTTSLVKYPVFVKGKNYTGYTPSLMGTPMLHRYVTDVFPKELERIDRPLVIPLGKVVSDALCGQVDPARCLFGFPHSSGANGHRRKQFDEKREEFRRKIEAFL